MPDIAVLPNSMVEAGLRSSCNSSKNRPDDKELAAQKELSRSEHIESLLNRTPVFLNAKM